MVKWPLRAIFQGFTYRAWAIKLIRLPTRVGSWRPGVEKSKRRIAGISPNSLFTSTHRRWAWLTRIPLEYPADCPDFPLCSKDRREARETLLDAYCAVGLGRWLCSTGSVVASAEFQYYRQPEQYHDQLEQHYDCSRGYCTIGRRVIPGGLGLTALTIE